MEESAFRAHLVRELTAYAEGLEAVADDDLWQTSVPSCPGWSVRDLTHHLLGVHQFVANAVSGVRGNDSGPPMPADDALAVTFSESAHMLVELLDQDAQTPCWSFGVDQRLGFWQRRQPHEHAIHRWDLESSLGLVSTLDPDLSADGIDEVVAMFWPRQITLGRAEAPGNRLRLVIDTGQAWTLGSLSPTEPVATVSGEAANVLLALWKRIPADSSALSWSGDQTAGRAILGLKVVP